MQQLDIFADSHDVMLGNDVLAPLQRREAAAARTALERLAGDYPDDGALPALTALVGELEHASTAPFADHASLAVACRHLEGEVVPAARRVLPAQTVQSWLAPSWRTLARRAASLPFRGADAGDHALNHAAPLWLLAGDAAAACTAVERIESWWRIPAPLAWMTEARYRTDGLDAAGPCSRSWRGWRLHGSRYCCPYWVTPRSTRCAGASMRSFPAPVQSTITPGLPRGWYS
ncbi:hypothetical protein [Paraburkholderia franconis]|uniref:hypothetical protein n=1 Tax=Paraburkholderia franconis TaxID=2654983 RepID=UPI001D10C2DE|nr:hypothetical protein [Paraburkholderia franconis]